MSVTYRGSTLDMGSHEGEFCKGLGGLPREGVDGFLVGKNNQIYTIKFTDDEEETCSAHDVTVNSKAASIEIVDVGFQFIQIFCGGWPLQWNYD